MWPPTLHISVGTIAFSVEKGWSFWIRIVILPFICRFFHCCMKWQTVTIRIVILPFIWMLCPFCMNWQTLTATAVHLGVR